MKIANALFIVCMLLSAMSCAQKSGKPKTKKPVVANTFHSKLIRESVFTDVIEITDSDFVTNGEDFLFTKPIPPATKIPVVFVSAPIPLNLLSTIYPQFSSVIVITPNWTYYDEVFKNQPEAGCAEPSASSVIYEFKREGGKVMKDSIVNASGFPEMKYSNPYQLKNKEQVIYFSEIYGSVCCPRDPQWDNPQTREEFVKYFEGENKVKIAGTYVNPQGDEGEAEFYYTLPNLTNQLRLKFIKERKYSRILNKEAKKIASVPRIYTPIILEIGDRKAI